MKHPNQEQWMDFIYGEADAEDAKDLRTHLATCEPCRRQVEAWRGTMSTLDAWKLAPANTTARTGSSLRWAAAAAIFLAAGISIGASLRQTPDVAALEKSIQQMADQSAATRALVDQLAQRVGKDQAAVVGAIRELETRRVNDLVDLRRDLERVAVATDAGLKLTQSQLVQLASYPQ